MRPSHYEYITQYGWLNRATNSGWAYPSEPSVTIPLSWLGLEEGDGYAQPEIIAAYFRAYLAIHAVTTSAATEVLKFSLQKRIDEQSETDPQPNRATVHDPAD